MPRRRRAARAVPAAARVAYHPASTRYQTGPLPLCTGVTSAGTPTSAASRSACASALSSDAYAASCTVHPSVSRRTATGRRGEGGLLEVVEGLEEVGGAAGAGEAGGAGGAARG